MKIAGIVCEYNPFHAGHARHIEETRRALPPDAGVVCVMSGSFTQRGSPAVFRKHVRAKAAVLGGADLVLELPLPWALSSAERFAFGGVSLLDKLGVCTHLSFGSECGDLEALNKAAAAASSEEGKKRTLENLGRGVSYAAARAEAMKALGADGSVFSEPNDTLAVEYLRALHAVGSPMAPLAVRRAGDRHDAPDGLSGRALRERLCAGEDISPFVPPEAMRLYAGELDAGRAPVVPEAMEAAVLARLRSMTDEEFAALPDATEGLDRRFMRAARTEPDILSFLAAVKTKRYALSRLRRMLCCAYLGVRAGDADGTPPYARVLAANGKGTEILAEAARRGKLPVLTKPAEVRSMDARAQRIFGLEAHATDLFSLAFPNVSERRGGQEWRLSPIIL
ncbi:MAG: nucleotidyltransferase family protein [Oscillospiraceae bacterium]|nr:nucleotidyltransferase family protein [Oscillospiraceae bacterium]